MAPILMVAATALSAYGQYKQGQAAEAEGKSAQNIANFNAAVQERQAEAERQKGRFEQKSQAKRGARTKSALAAKVAASGGLGSPVAADLAVEQAAELELENLLIGFESEVAAKRAENQATLDRFQGRIYKKRGKNIKMAKQIGAGTTLLTGFGSIEQTPAQKDAALAKKHGKK